MSKVDTMQYKVEQDTLNRLYRKLKRNLNWFRLAERIELKKTLYNRCLQQVFVKKDSIKLTFIERWEYDSHYGGDGVDFWVNLCCDTYTSGVTLCQEYVHYRDIQKIVYNERMQRLEIWGRVKYKRMQEKKQKDVLMIYNLFDLKPLIEMIEQEYGLKLCEK